MIIIIWAGRALAAMAMAGGAYWHKVLRDSEENGGRRVPRGQGGSGDHRGFKAPEETRDVRVFPGCAAISVPRDPVVSRGCAATWVRRGIRGISALRACAATPGR